jgi:hypothetical protein
MATRVHDGQHDCTQDNASPDNRKEDSVEQAVAFAVLVYGRGSCGVDVETEGPQYFLIRATSHISDLELFIGAVVGEEEAPAVLVGVVVGAVIFGPEIRNNNINAMRQDEEDCVWCLELPHLVF